MGNIGFGSFIEDLKSYGKNLGFPFASTNIDNEFLALDNVSFSVKEGEVLGIIGHNGAGKSTLLKILSRITEPTKGKAILRGRVSSLLEVGTGFNGEMTGRENIYLNGALYGLSRIEISNQLDSIIDFSQVENFIDTPVKRYSSGMYVRLAFAVAAHLQPEILIVDEVLAVGDVDFQKKCVDKMQEVSKSGRTILFVSHNLQTIRSLCNNCIVLKHGKISFRGSTSEAINQYVGTKNSNNDCSGLVKFDRNSERYGTGEVLIEEILVKNSMGEPTNTLFYQEDFSIEIKCRVLEPISNLALFLSVTDSADIFHGLSYTCDKFPNPCPDSGVISFKLSSRTQLLPGKHFILPCLSNMCRAIDQIQRAFAINVLHQGCMKSPSFPLQEVRGSYRLEGDWQVLQDN